MVVSAGWVRGRGGNRAWDKTSAPSRLTGPLRRRTQRNGEHRTISNRQKTHQGATDRAGSKIITRPTSYNERYAVASRAIFTLLLASVWSKRSYPKCTSCKCWLLRSDSPNKCQDKQRKKLCNTAVADQQAPEYFITDPCHVHVRNNSFEPTGVPSVMWGGSVVDHLTFLQTQE